MGDLRMSNSLQIKMLTIASKNIYRGLGYRFYANISMSCAKKNTHKVALKIWSLVDHNPLTPSLIVSCFNWPIYYSKIIYLTRVPWEKKKNEKYGKI